MRLFPDESVGTALDSDSVGDVARKPQVAVMREFALVPGRLLADGGGGRGGGLEALLRLLHQRELIGDGDEDLLDAGVLLAHGSRDHLPNNPLVFDADATSSYHLSGVNFLLGDGSVQSISNTIKGTVFEVLLTRAGGEAVSEDY